ncbi:limonene-1,2-epoxide hydrolase [Rhodococcus opacus]|uniref:Limonene-1,2-epoxide hydrolase n=1 Tax=Rhodococcus opacus TaxID=37919 RepID=A0A2S8J4F4_RHOOP|nr:limonene-1,2-epoxide hydrolase [Rhodococcus opacus]
MTPVPVESESANEELARRFLAAMGRLDVPALSDLLAEDATWWLAGDLPVSGFYDGKPAVIGDFLWSAAALFELGSLGFELHHLVSAADTVVAEYVGTGRGMISGTPYRNTYCTVFGCRDSKISSVREYLDTAHVGEVLYQPGNA